jgi:hypothetical protein
LAPGDIADPANPSLVTILLVFDVILPCIAVYLAHLSDEVGAEWKASTDDASDTRSLLVLQTRTVLHRLLGARQTQGTRHRAV